MTNLSRGGVGGWVPHPSEQKLEMMRNIMSLLKTRGWCTLEEFIGETGRNWWAVTDALGQLKGNEQVFSVGIPGARGKLLWRRTTRSVARLVREKTEWERVTMTELPWRLKISFVRKVGDLRRENVIRHGLAYWAMADVEAERHMIKAGLCQARPRPERGLYYGCGWFINPEYNPHGSSSLHAAYTFEIGFAAKTNFKTTIPPFVPHNGSEDGERPGIVSEEYGFFTDPDCAYELKTEPHSTTLWLSAVSTISSNPLGGIVHAPTTEQLIEETGTLIREGAKKIPALALFIPLPTSQTLELLSAAPKRSRSIRR